MLITDNETQFDNRKMREQSQKIKIDHKFSFISHPQTNGQVKLTNKILLNGLKKKMEGAKGEWAMLLDKTL